MNKDLDERLIPPGQYRDGQNIGVSTSEDSNVGSIENMLGNTQVGGDLSYLSSAAKTIGAIANPSSEEFYWFVTDTSFDYIIRYNEPSNSAVPVLKDTKGRILKFDSEHVITGINIVGNLLFWTDNLNPPRRLNIDRYYAVDSFTEDDISVIVKPPLERPTIELQNTTGATIPSTLDNAVNNISEKYLRFGYRWRYENNEYSSLSPFSATSFGPTNYAFNYAEGVFTSMINGFNQVKILFNTGGSQVKDVQLVFFNEFTGSVYTIETFKKDKNNWADNSTQSALFNNSKIFSIISPDEVSRLFDNVPKKALAQDIIGSRLIYGNYVQGYNIQDAWGDDLAIDFTLGLQNKETGSSGVPSFHSDRDYEAGLVYLDDYGRMSTVLVPNVSNNEFGNTTYISPDYSNTINDLRVKINHRPPEFASKFRIYLKQSKDNNYSSIFPIVYYRDGTDFYFFIQRSEVNKVKEGSFIYMKQLNGIATNSNKQYKVLEVEVKEEGFLGNNEFGGLYFKISDDTNSIIIDQFEGEWLGEGVGGEPTTGSNKGFQYILVNEPFGAGGVNFNGVSEGVAQIDFPHHYGSSTTHNSIQLHSNYGAKVSENATNAQRDARIKITITANETFKVENFRDGIYELWYENVSLASYYNAPYYINNPPPSAIPGQSTLDYDLDMYIRFWRGPGYNQGDYFTINVHSSFGLNNFEINTSFSGTSTSTPPSGNPDILSGISPASGGLTDTGLVAFSEPDTNLNSTFNYRDKAVKAGAIIEMKVIEKIYTGESITGEQETENLFFSNGNYDNIEEWFYEEDIWQTFRHIDCQDGNINNRGKRIFFRRVFSDLRVTPSLGVSGSGINQVCFVQAKSNGPNGAPYLNGQGNWQDYASKLSYEMPVVMFIRGSQIQDQTTGFSQSGTNPNLKVIEIDVEFKIAQTENGTPVFETKPLDIDSDIFYETPFTFNIDKTNNIHEGNISNQSTTPGGAPAEISLNPNSKTSPTTSEQQNSEYNCFTFGNGVEATRIKGEFNEAFLRYSPRSSSSIEDYREEHLEASLTYSGVFVENTNINNLNEFNLSLANFKDVNKEYGPIQKLHSRDTDVVLFQEDKVSKVLYGKNLLSDSVGGGSVASIPQVLGTQITYTGEYGISENPESFASWGNNMYFTDSKRGAVLQLGINGIFEISQLGMSDYFKDLFRDNLTTQKLGAIDPFKEQYVLSSNTTPAPACDFSFSPNFTPQLDRNGATVTMDITSSQSWTITLVDTGAGTNWIQINGVTPTYGNTGDETVSFTVASNLVSGQDRSLNLTITGCDGVTHTQALTQSGQNVLELDPWGISRGTGGTGTTTGNTTSSQTASLTYDFTSNTGSAIEYLDQEMVPESNLFINTSNVGVEGFNGVPATGDTVTLKASQSGATNRQTFAPSLGGKMYYLLSNTKYFQNQINTVLADPNIVELTPALTGNEWIGSFILNRTGYDYIYLMIDYRNRLTSGSSSQFNIPAATNSVAGIFEGQIDFGSKRGRVSLPYTPSTASGNIYNIKQNGTVIASSGKTPTTTPGTIGFLKASDDNIFDVEIQYYGDNQAVVLDVPDPVLTQFVYENSDSVLDPTRANYVCRTGAMPTTTKYHNGVNALPQEGDIIYENPAGTQVVGNNDYHRYGTATPPASTYLFVTNEGVVTQTSTCATCTETAVPVITIPSSINLNQNEFVNFKIEATNDPIFYNVVGTCINIQVTAGANGATISWSDCQNVARTASMSGLGSMVIQTTGSYTTTSGTTTSVTLGALAETYLPQGLTFDQNKGIFEGSPSETGTFPFVFTAQNCFGTTSNTTFNINIIEEGQKTFEMDGSQFKTSSSDACSITPGQLNSTLFYHSGRTVYPQVNDTVTVPVIGQGGTGSRDVFRGGYVWYKAPWDTAGVGNGTALLIDDRGVIVEIATCP